MKWVVLFVFYYYSLYVQVLWCSQSVHELWNINKMSFLLVCDCVLVEVWYMGDSCLSYKLIESWFTLWESFERKSDSDRLVHSVLLGSSHIVKGSYQEPTFGTFSPFHATQENARYLLCQAKRASLRPLSAQQRNLSGQQRVRSSFLKKPRNETFSVLLQIVNRQVYSEHNRANTWITSIQQLMDFVWLLELSVSKLNQTKLIHRSPTSKQTKT